MIIYNNQKMASTRKTFNEKTDGCRFGDSCFDTKCRYGHPEQCRHDPRCSNSNCKFWHPLANASNNGRTEKTTYRDERPVHRAERPSLRDERPSLRDERPVQRKHQSERSQKEHQTESFRGTPNVFAEKLIEMYEAEIKELKKKVEKQETEIKELKEENAKLKPSGMQQPVNRGLFS